MYMTTVLATVYICAHARPAHYSSHGHVCAGSPVRHSAHLVFSMLLQILGYKSALCSGLPPSRPVEHANPRKLLT